MKFDDFKIFKFSTILKIIDFRRYNFSRIYRSINFKRYKYILVYVVDFVILVIEHIFSGVHKSFNFIKHNFSRVYKNINFKKYNFFNIYKFSDIRRYNLLDVYKFSGFRRHNLLDVYKFSGFKRYNFSRIYRYFNFRRYNFSKIFRYLEIKRYKNIPGYATGIVVFSVFTYLSIPLFFNYDKSKLANTICKGLNVKCSIQGKINYSFFPSPRIKIKDLIIEDFVDQKRTLGKIENATIRLSFYNLSNKEKFNYSKMELKNAEINFDLKKFNEYKIFFKKTFNSKPINLKKGEIKFFEDEKDIAIIRDVNFKYKSNKDIDKAILKGTFLEDAIYINIQNHKVENNSSKTFFLKFSSPELFTEINIFNLDSEKNIIGGNVLLKKDKNRLRGTFDYKNDKIIFKHANLRNDFLNGKFDGEIKFLPYFNFNLNMDFSDVNFNRFYSFLINLDDENKKNLFKINKKINGQLNLSSDKIFSKHTLINSFESRIKFVNGNILIDQLLLNMGKLGAADIIGIIKNGEKFTNFKFENNIFVDNLRRFYNKFSIYNKQNISSNLFISGNFDLMNLNLRLKEISSDKKFKDEDVEYIEKEFNDIVLENGYASLFNFLKLKEFVKLMTNETN